MYNYLFAPGINPVSRNSMLPLYFILHDGKTANVIPIFKKGSRTDTANYRPVTLTSVPCKIMQSLIKPAWHHSWKRIKWLLTDSMGLWNTVWSCTTNLLECFESWIWGRCDIFRLQKSLWYFYNLKTNWETENLRMQVQGHTMNKEFLTARTMKVQTKGSFLGDRL